MKLDNYLKTEMGEIQLMDYFHVDKEFVHIELESKLSPYDENNTENLNMKYFQSVHKKAIEIFDDLFEEGEELYLVARVCRKIPDYPAIPNRTIFRKYLKDKYRLHRTTGINNENEQMELYSVLLYDKNKLNYKKIMKAICEQDYHVPSKEKRKFELVYFVHKKKNLIVNIYDDRGCCIVFKDREGYKTYLEQHPNLELATFDYEVEESERYFVYK